MKNLRKGKELIKLFFTKEEKEYLRQFVNQVKLGIYDNTSFIGRIICESIKRGDLCNEL